MAATLLPAPSWGLAAASFLVPRLFAAYGGSPPTLQCGQVCRTALLLFCRRRFYRLCRHTFYLCCLNFYQLRIYFAGGSDCISQLYQTGIYPHWHSGLIIWLNFLFLYCYLLFEELFYFTHWWPFLFVFRRRWRGTRCYSFQRKTSCRNCMDYRDCFLHHNDETLNAVISLVL